MTNAPVYTACGKQVLRDGEHFADLCGPREAAAIADLLNAQMVMMGMPDERTDEIVGVLWP